TNINEDFTIRGLHITSQDVALNGLYGVLPYYRVPMEIAESVEILKGPSALLSGMAPGGNVAGAINIVPKRAGYAAHAGIGRLLVPFPIWHKYRHGAPLWHGWPVRDSRQRFISLRRYNHPQSKCPGRPVLGRAGLPRQARTRL